MRARAPEPPEPLLDVRHVHHALSGWGGEPEPYVTRRGWQVLGTVLAAVAVAGFLAGFLAAGVVLL